MSKFFYVDKAYLISTIVDIGITSRNVIGSIKHI